MQSKGSSSTTVLGICELLHFLGPLLPACCQWWPASVGVAVVVVGGRPKSPSRELSYVLPCHIRPCGELRIGRPARRRESLMTFYTQKAFKFVPLFKVTVFMPDLANRPFPPRHKFQFWRKSLLCRVGKLAGRGSVINNAALFRYWLNH